MQIQGPGPLSGPERISGPRSGGSRAPRPEPVRAGEDRVELSDAARYLEKLKKLPAIRTDKVDRLREAVESGEYDSEEKLRIAIDRMIQDVEDLGLAPPEGE